MCSPKKNKQNEHNLRRKILPLSHPQQETQTRDSFLTRQKKATKNINCSAKSIQAVALALLFRFLSTRLKKRTHLKKHFPFDMKGSFLRGPLCKDFLGRSIIH